MTSLRTEPRGHGYPRPLLRRDEDGWICLNGAWEFAIDEHAIWSRPDEVAWSGPIEVPFAPETERSGVGVTGYFHACWYRRTVVVRRSRGRASPAGHQPSERGHG